MLLILLLCLCPNVEGGIEQSSTNTSGVIRRSRNSGSFLSQTSSMEMEKQQLADEHSSALYWSHMRPFLWTDVYAPYRHLNIRNVLEKHLFPIPLQLPAAARPNNHNKCHSKVWKQHRFIKSQAKYHPVCTSWPQFCAPNISTFFPSSLKAFFVLMAPFNLGSFRGPLFSPTRRERL